MRHKHGVLTVACFLFALVYACPVRGASEPNSNPTELTEEKMVRLRQVYREVQQAETELVRLIEQSEQQEPLLRPTKDALIKMNDYGESLDHKRFAEYLSGSSDKEKTKWLYVDCKAVFSRDKIAALLEDPNQAKLLKKPYIYGFRKMAATMTADGFDAFDPNDPNDERLWQNTRGIYFKRMTDEQVQQRRQHYIETMHVPEWLPEYAGNVAFAHGMSNMYEVGIYLLTPKEVRDAEKRVDDLYMKISWIYYKWGQMRDILGTENNPNNDAVIAKVQEHMFFFLIER